MERRIVRAAILLAAAVPCLAASDLPRFESQILAAHNAERTRVGVLPLEWSKTLAKDAEAWARALAASGRFEHAPQRGASPPEGENLWMGTKQAYAPDEMVQSWIDEKSNYRRGRFPNVSRTGAWADVGHYTQLIWSATTQVGCARVSNAEDDYLVCRYFPSGNWEGVDPEENHPAAQAGKRRTRNQRPRNKI